MSTLEASTLRRWDLLEFPGDHLRSHQSEAVPGLFITYSIKSQ